MKGDFLGFSFNGVHSDDMGIVRMSDGSRYSTDLTPEIEDRTNSVPGRDGVYFYGSDFKDGKISVKVAFDQLTDRQFRALRKWLGVKEPAPLIFDEFPFKKYMAKLASTPVFDYVCFDERRRWPSETAQDGVRVVDRTTVTEDVPYTEDLTVENGSSIIISRKPETVTVTYEDEQLVAEDFDYTSETGELSIHITDVESGDAINVTVDYTIEESRTEIEREQVYPYEYADDVERIYKGEGTIDFEIPFPYAIGTGVTVEDVREDASVPEQWEGASYLPTAAEYVEYGINQYDNGVIPVYNCGDVPTGFKLTLEPGSSSGSEGRATGNPIIVNNAAGEVSNLTVDLEPVQDLHGYDKPWAGGAGKNKFDESTLVQGNWNYEGPNTPNNVVTHGYLPIKGGITYMWSQTELVAGRYIRFYDANQEYDASGDVTQYNATNATFNAPQWAVYMRVLWYSTSEITPDDIKALKPQIEEGTTATSWEPYSNICPITGHDSVTVTDTGKNLFDKSTALDGYINDVNGNFMPSQTRKATDFIRVFGGESYLIKTAQTESEWGAWYDANKNFIVKCNGYEGDTVKTAPANACYLRLTCVGTSSGNLDTFAVNYPSTDTSYHAYYGHTTTVTLPHTVYGGDVDVTGGAGTEAWKSVTFNGSEDENWITDVSSGHYRAYISISDAKSFDEGYNIVCNTYKCDTYSNGKWGEVFTGNAVAGQIGQNWGVGIDNLGITTTAGWKAYLANNPITIAYELATPTDLTTTPTRVTLYEGSNTLTSNGDMDLTYVKTTTGGITYKDKHLDIDFSIMPFEENNDTAVVVDTFNRVIRGVDSGVLYNKCIVGGDFFLLDPSTDIDDSDEQISLALENSQFSSITYDYLFY